MLSMYEWLIIATSLVAIYFCTQTILSKNKKFVFTGNNKGIRAASVALLCIPIVQVFFPDENQPMTMVILICDVILAISGLILLLARSGITDEAVYLYSLRYPYNKILEYKVTRNTASGRTELWFRTKSIQRIVKLPLGEYNKILRFMRQKKEPEKKANKNEEAAKTVVVDTIEVKRNTKKNA